MPPGAETAWAYSHIPQRPVGDDGGTITGDWEGGDGERMAERMEAQIEARAPGFRASILGRHICTPTTMAAENPNLVGGALAGGTSQLHQELIFRPLPGLARTETPIRALYLASASAHPGGGVHGACGNSAARAALWHDRADRLRHGRLSR
jgi:phytoene dehydrogenase-like protein